MRPALLLALWPALASAQDATRYVWGDPVEGSEPSALSLEPCDLPCVAVVRFDNTLVTQGIDIGMGAPDSVRTTLAIPGVALAVTVETGGGLTPDLMQVLPPPGYAAQPREVLVEDNASGHVRVVLAPTSQGERHDTGRIGPSVTPSHHRTQMVLQMSVAAEDAFVEALDRVLGDVGPEEGQPQREETCLVALDHLSDNEEEDGDEGEDDGGTVPRR